MNSFNKEALFTGFYSFTGEKIYLGDKVRQFVAAHTSITFIVEYDDSDQSFHLVPPGRKTNKGPFRKYPLEGNLDSSHSEFYVTHNAIFCYTPNVGEQVKVTVTNKSEGFPFGSYAEVLSIDTWSVMLGSAINGEEQEFSFGEFMEKRELYKVKRKASNG